MLRLATRVEGSTAEATVRLDALDSLRDTLTWYVAVLESARVVARRVAPHRIELCPEGGGHARVRLRYTGAPVERVVVSDGDGAVVAEAEGAKMRDEGMEFPLHARVIVEARGAAADCVGPAVDIERVEAGTASLSVRVRAADRSGVATVALYCDDALVGEKRKPPYAWLWPVAEGWHRVHAVATDGAARPNASTSFARTVCVRKTAAE